MSGMDGWIPMMYNGGPEPPAGSTSARDWHPMHERRRLSYDMMVWEETETVAVCSNLSADAVIARLISERPGVWEVGDGEGAWASGKPNPYPCRDCDGYQHWVFIHRWRGRRVVPEPAVIEDWVKEELERKE